MSSNPANTLPPRYDEALPDDYDPAFTADISTKMRVPERIGGSEHGDEGMGHPSWVPQSSHMNVPEKIVLAGQESSIGMKDDPQLHYEPLVGSTHVGLQTPPRVLTLDERPFMDMEEEKQDTEEYLMWTQGNKSRQDFSSQNGFVSPSPGKHSSDSLALEASMSIPGDGLLIRDEQSEGDVSALRRQMAKLSRHVMRLEEENSKRSNREMVLYPLVIGYMLFQVAKWFVHGR